MAEWKLSGAEQLIGDLEKMGQQLSAQGGHQNAIRRALESGAQPVLNRMEQNAPRRSGRLKGAIKTGNVRLRKGRYTITIGVHTNDDAVRYAHLVEFGHGGPHPAPPHPFMRPAFDATVEEAYAEIKSGLAAALDSLL